MHCLKRLEPGFKRKFDDTMTKKLENMDMIQLINKKLETSYRVGNENIKHTKTHGYKFYKEALKKHGGGNSRMCE